jgi:hypothetical protein
MKKVETSVERVLIKLNDMLHKRFGVQAEYLPLYGGPKELQATMETVKRNSGAPMIVAHNEMIVPIRVDGVLAGATRVEEISGLSPIELSQIRETIDLVMTEVLAARRRIEILAITEDILGNEKDNVISLKGRREAQSPEVVNH